MLGGGAGCQLSPALVARAEEGRECSNQLSPLNEQLIGGCLDRKLEEARRRRKWGRGEEMGRRGEGGGAEEGGERGRGWREGRRGRGGGGRGRGGGRMGIYLPHQAGSIYRARGTHTAGVYTEGLEGGSQFAITGGDRG